MSRSVAEIAGDLRDAVTVIARTNAEMASAATGAPTPTGLPHIEVRLDDGRLVELSELADELLGLAGEEE